MARIDSKVIFVTTSPRTPAKMIPEIGLLHAHFAGQKWNNETQRAFMELLREENFFNGKGANDPAFSARDRINRAPKALGFVILSPTIQLTPAGEELVNSRRKDEIFLRQLLKFQVPSPFHKPTANSAEFRVKPYLELFRLIRHFGSLKFDEFGNPMSTAQGNMADIVCDYGDFGLTVEVTMQSGQRQYETEGEPVTRHLAKYKRETEKPAYCLFIAPNTNDACKAHFYALHKMNIQYYGGTSTIVPLPLSVFIKMVRDSHNANYVPEPRHVQRFFERSNELAKSTDNEVDWYNGITEKALNWLDE